MRKPPRVLIAAPTSSRHSKVIRKWMKAVDELQYDKDRYAVLLVDNSKKKGKYGKMLRKWGAKVIDLDWNDKKEHPLQMLARARETYRLEAWKRKFDYILHLDTDVIIPKNGLKKLLSHDKDQVGFVIHAFYTRKGFERAYGKLIRKAKLKYSDFKSKPMIFRSGALQKTPKGWTTDYYDWKDIRSFKGKTVRVYASTIACLLVKKKVYSTIPFRTNDSLLWGEDLWYYAEADEKGFESWCDTSVRCTHLNTSWQGIGSSPHKVGFEVAVTDTFHPINDDIAKAAKSGKVKVAV